MEASEPKPPMTPPAVSAPSPTAPKPPASPTRALEQAQAPQHEGVQQSEEDKRNERHGAAGWKERVLRFEGVSVHAIAGALHDLGAEDRITEDEVRQRLEAFRSREGVEASE